MSDRLVSVNETAERLGLARSTIRLWVRLGKIGHVKLSRRVLIPDVEIRRLVQCNTVPAIAAQGNPATAPGPQAAFDWKMRQAADNDF